MLKLSAFAFSSITLFPTFYPEATSVYDIFFKSVLIYDPIFHYDPLIIASFFQTTFYTKLSMSGVTNLQLMICADTQKN